jgi:hypothetical protein
MAGQGQDVAGRVQDAAEVPLIEAARLLNMTPEALRKRLQRGKSIRGIERDGEWFVRLPATVAGRGQDTSGPASGRGQDASGHGLDVGRDMAGHVQDASAVVVDALRHQRDQLEATVADLRARLDTAEQAQAELRRLLAAALQQRALPAPAAPPSSDTSTARPWWERWLWWRR